MLEIILGIVIAAIILGLIILLSLLLFLIYCVVRHKAKRSQENIGTLFAICASTTYIHKYMGQAH